MKCLKYPLDKLEIEERQKKSRFDFQDERTRTVERIVDDVRENGDQAVFKYTEKYDGVKLKGLKVSREEIDRAYEMIDKDFLASLRKSIDNVAAYHRKQLRNSWFTFEKGMTGQLFIPLERVGAYVPGGTAPLPSSVVMTVVPARAAGVKEIVVVSPPDKNGSINPYTLVAASEAGADEIYKAGGAQAIAAMAYGTETIPKKSYMS